MKYRIRGLKPNLSLRSKMVLGGILILLLPMTVIGFVTFIKSSRTLRNIYEKELVQIAESLSGMIQIALEKDLRILWEVASAPLIIEDALRGDREDTQTHLTFLYHALAKDFEGLSVYDADGVIRSTGVADGSMGHSISKTGFFKTTKKGTAAVAGMVSSKTTGDPVFSLSVPILSADGDFLGGVLGVVKADYLMPYISSIKIGTSGHVFMVDEDGMFIAHPKRAAILSSNIRTEVGLEDLARKMLRQETGTVTYLFHGDWKVAGVSPVGLTKWSIAVNQDESEIMALAYANMNFILLFSAVSILLIIPVVFFFSGTISTPVQKTLSTLNHAASQATDGIVIIGVDGQILFANPAMAAIADRPVQEIARKPFRIGTEERTFDKEIQNAIGNGEIWNGHVSGRRKDGNRFSADLTITPVRNPDGKITGCLVVGRDITQELVMQERLQQSQKMEAIGTLAGGIAHDFNNILGAVFGYTELALTALEDRELLKSHLAQVIGAAERARDLVKHILAFSRKTEVGREPIVPKYVVKEALKLLRASLPATIEIRENLNCSAAILGDPTQLHQITMNLCANAGYEMKDAGGVLGVRLDETVLEEAFTVQHPGMKPGRYLQLEITDSGRGIADDILERIFDPFFTTKPTGQGTGLGLSVVHGIVKSLGGTVTVSGNCGNGSAFTVYLPIIEGWMPGPQASLLEQIPGGTERILLVDDEEEILRSLQAIMEGLGYRVEAFTRGEPAWKTFHDHPDSFDIIVTDYTMPGMTGTALARKIRGRRPDIPIIICSGYVALKEKGDHLEPISFVKKPVTTSELSHALRRALGKSLQPMPSERRSVT